MGSCRSRASDVDGTSGEVTAPVLMATLGSFTVALLEAGRKESMTTLPLWIWVAGVVLLGITLAYAMRRDGTRTGRERAITEEATQENYRQEDRSPE
jgi:hypothetical protein